MSRESIAVYSSQTLPDSYASIALPVRIDLSGRNWQSLTLELALTNNSENGIVGHQLKLHYGFLSVDIDPTTAAQSIVHQNSSPYRLDNEVSDIPHLAPNGTTYIVSPIITIAGDYMYVWIEICEGEAEYSNITAALTAVQTV